MKYQIACSEFDVDWQRLPVPALPPDPDLVVVVEVPVGQVAHGGQLRARGQEAVGRLGRQRLAPRHQRLQMLIDKEIFRKLLKRDLMYTGKL